MVKFISSDCSCYSRPKTGERRRVGGSDCSKLQEAGGLGIVLEGQVRSGWWEMKVHQLCKGLEEGGLGMAVRKESG